MGNRNDLGNFLKASRNRRHPEELGIPAGAGVRRTPGLRREELAAAAGISVDYYTRLEQGRERNPSGAVLESLARVLRLGDAQRQHLLNLARHAQGPVARPADTEPLRPTVLQLLDTVGAYPAYVLDHINNVRAANASGWALLRGIDQWPQERRNSVRFLFLHPAARTLYVHWHEVAEQSVAHLRAVSGDHPCDPGLTALVHELSSKSEEFEQMWRSNDVQPKANGVKCYDHPDVGRMDLSYEVLTVRGTNQSLVVYQATPGTPDHDALMLLGLAAQQRVSEGREREVEL